MSKTVCALGSEEKCGPFSWLISEEMLFYRTGSIQAGLLPLSSVGLFSITSRGSSKLQLSTDVGRMNASTW